MSNSTNDTVNWQWEPNTRGTWSILSTCILTLLLCFWSAVHLNLPGQQTDSYVARSLRRAAWILRGLLIPEVLVTVAIDQRQIAQRISREVELAFRTDRTQVRDSTRTEERFV